ncbi:hypothetical protein GCM10009867_27050 [Pedococcus aerophilus]|uniref:Secreted protein n=1 Tax=Pedococcus aerophilus TaxID=436356 RepID=A0ABN3UTC8_9MICO
MRVVELGDAVVVTVTVVGSGEVEVDSVLEVVLEVGVVEVVPEALVVSVLPQAPSRPRPSRPAVAVRTVVVRVVVIELPCLVVSRAAAPSPLTTPYDLAGLAAQLTRWLHRVLATVRGRAPHSEAGGWDLVDPTPRRRPLRTDSRAALRAVRLFVPCRVDERAGLIVPCRCVLKVALW